MTDNSYGMAAIAKPALQLTHGRPSEYRDLPVGGKAVVCYHHSSFESAMRNILADIDHHAGLIVLIGEAGIGKTFFVSRVIESLNKAVIPLLLCYPRFTFEEFISFACKELQLSAPKAQVDTRLEDQFEAFWSYLLAQRAQERSVAIFVDEAQEMSEDLLGDLLLLSKPDTSGEHLLQIILAGLPGLATTLHQPALRELIPKDLQLYTLVPLKLREVKEFMAVQLATLGDEALEFFSTKSIEKIATYSRGIPGLIYTLCSRALSVAKIENRKVITADLVDEIARAVVIDSHAQEVSKPQVLESVQPATVRYPWLGRLISSSTEQDKVMAHKGSNNSTFIRIISSNTEQEKPMSRVDNLNKILKNLQNETPGVEASALISEDGLMIAGALPQELDETRVAGMTATLLNLGTRAATELRRGDVQEVIVRGEYGYSVMISAGRGALLLVLTNENAKLGLIFFDMREAIKAIKNIL